MSALLTRGAGRRPAAVTLVLAVAAGGMLFGAGTASAATAVTCSIGGEVSGPVAVQPSQQVQLVLVVPGLGTRVNVGPVQNVGTTPGVQVLSATVGTVLGVIVNDVCRAAVDVQAVVTSVVPPPPVRVPTLPVPSQSVTVPVPGAPITVEVGESDTSGGTAPAPSQPPAGSQPTGTVPPNGGWRFDNAGIPLYEFSAVPFDIGYRFGNMAAPAFRFGQRVPGYAPQFGILGAETGDGLAPVGSVQSLPVGGAKVALPVLLAVLLLSAVTGTLVRTWAIRRA